MEYAPRYVGARPPSLRPIRRPALLPSRSQRQAGRRAQRSRPRYPAHPPQAIRRRTKNKMWPNNRANIPHIALKSEGNMAAAWQATFFLLRKPSRQEKAAHSSRFFLSFGLHCRKKKSLISGLCFIFRRGFGCSYVAMKTPSSYLFSRRFRYRFTI